MNRATVHSTALENARVISDGPCVLNSLFVHNTGPDQFIQVYDQKLARDEDYTDLDAANLVLIIPITADTTAAPGADIVGLRFANGCVAVNSTTATTYTAGSADCWFTASI
jgi:hypothetical protein